MPVEPPVASPRSLAEAYALLGDAPHRPLAGGTDLLVQITGDLGDPPERVLDLWQLDELRGIRMESDALVLGALTTYAELRRSPLIAEFLPAFAEAASTIGAGADPEPRDDRRERDERFPGGRHAAAPARLRCAADRRHGER